MGRKSKFKKMGGEEYKVFVNFLHPWLKEKQSLEVELCRARDELDTTNSNLTLVQVHADQFNMAVFFWYRGKSDLYTCTKAYTVQVTFYKFPCFSRQYFHQRP